MAQPRAAIQFDGAYIKSFHLHSEAVTASTTIEVGDLVRYQTETDPLTSGVALFDTATEDELFLGISKGKSQTTMVSGAYGDAIPVNTKCIIECPLSSGNYNFGEGLGYSGTKNTLEGDTVTTNPTVAWFWGEDANSITTGLVLVDIYLLRTLIAASI